MTTAVNQNFTLPTDLYIPPDAMQVILEIFEGPLDLLLYLIKKHNLDILDIPVASITKQYVTYVETMQVLHIELAADYLEMAALLTEIKSRMLLPRPANNNEDDIDPRAELVRRLQVYEQIKMAASQINDLPRNGRDFFVTHIDTSNINCIKPQPEVELTELLLALKEVLTKVELQTAHNIERESLSIRDKMSIILSKVQHDKFVDFKKFFNLQEGRLGVVVTFLAILEMVKERILELIQSEAYAPIYVRAAIC